MLWYIYYDKRFLNKKCIKCSYVKFLKITSALSQLITTAVSQRFAISLDEWVTKVHTRTFSSRLTLLIQPYVGVPYLLS